MLMCVCWGGVGKGVLHCNGVLGGRVGAAREGGGLNEATFLPIHSQNPSRCILLFLNRLSPHFVHDPSTDNEIMTTVANTSAHSLQN